MSRIPLEANMRSSLKSSSVKKNGPTEVSRHVTFANQSKANTPQAKAAAPVLNPILGNIQKSPRASKIPCAQPQQQQKTTTIASPLKRQKGSSTEGQQFKKNKHNEAIVRLTEMQRTMVPSARTMKEVNRKAEKCLLPHLKTLIDSAFPLIESSLAFDMKADELAEIVKETKRASDEQDVKVNAELEEFGAMCCHLEQLLALADSSEGGIEQRCNSVKDTAFGENDDQSLVSHIDSFADDLLVYSEMLDGLANFQLH